jgi:glycosyltransferase involved in cell wall biosynthesis
MGTMVKAARILDGKSPIKFFIVSKIRPVEGVLPSNMIHLAPRPYVNMPPLLSAMDVGLAIYRKESWSRYGTFSSPLKVFDYLSSGLIAVCSPIEQAAKLHARSPKAVKLVPFEEPGLLADALLHIAATARESSDRATAARALVIEYYNWSRVACETATAIARIGTKRE